MTAHWPPDREWSDAELVTESERLLSAEAARDAAAMERVFGKLPDWLPEPVLPRIEQALAALRNAEQSPERIAELVAQASRDEEFEVPGSAREATAFIQAVHYLASVQWALSLPKADAISELGGTLAAQTYQRSRAGQRAQSGISESERASRDQRIRRRAQELAAVSPTISSNAQAAALAPEFNLSGRQIKRILKG